MPIKVTATSSEWPGKPGCCDAGEVTLGDSKIRVIPRIHVHIPQATAHRIHNTGTSPLVFVEMQLGDRLSKADIVRIDDNYGRDTKSSDDDP